MRRVLIVGCGFLGEAATFVFRQKGWEVFAVTATEAHASALLSQGIHCLVADVSDPLSLLAIQKKIGSPDAWIHCASSGHGNAEQYEKVYLQGIRNLLLTFPESRGLFTSSTSVYAQTDGSWVSETSATLPLRQTGSVLLASEKILLDAGGIVVRLAGIYGPSRSVLLQKFLSRQATLEGDGSRWINQIHKNDAALALAALLTQGKPGEIYNLSDDIPMKQIDLFREMASRLSLPLPPFTEPNLNRKRGWTNKRVSNAKLSSLGWTPIYPSYFSAWDALLASVSPLP